MRSVSIYIEGDFWDSQIYSGELLLFGCGGELHKIDWSPIIDELANENLKIQTALRVAFSDSDLFYTQKVRKILRDPEIESIIKTQLTNLNSLDIVTSQEKWSNYWHTIDTPFSFLPIDTDIYYNHIIASGDEGLFTTSRNTSKAIRKHHDGKILQVRASNQNTAVAAAGGNDGLFEFSFHKIDENISNEVKRVSKSACSACDWAFQSIIAWSSQHAFFANFKKEKDLRTNKAIRSFDKIIKQHQIFGVNESEYESATNYTWGSHEKIYRLSSDRLDVFQYDVSKYNNKKLKSQKVKENHSDFKLHGSFSLKYNPSEIIATGTAPFGTVLEFCDKIIVLRSDGEIETFDGEPVHWRVFPRSEHYSNQLHIIYDEKIKIISFVHDYFVDQNTKLMGFSRGSNDFIVNRPNG